MKTSNTASGFIYKIVAGEHWQQAQALDYVPMMPVDVGDGYMHFSTADQLAKTLELYFAGQSHVVILAVQVSPIKQDLKWEPSREGALFPHLYAPLPKSAVVWHEVLDVAADGSCNLPEKII